MTGAFLVLMLLASPAAAQNLPELPDLGDLPEPARYLAGYVSAGVGWSRPFGGHWGDRDAGFSTSRSLELSVSKRIDEFLRYGLETFYSGKYASRSLEGLSLSVISFEPFLRASFSQGNKVVYGMFGAGVCQWKQPAFTSGGIRFGSDSGSSGGLSFGGGISSPFWFGTMAGLELRWRRIFNLRGANLDLGAADSINLGLTFTYGVWKDKKSPVPSP